MTTDKRKKSSDASTLKTVQECSACLKLKKELKKKTDLLGKAKKDIKQLEKELIEYYDLLAELDDLPKDIQAMIDIEVSYKETAEKKRRSDIGKNAAEARYSQPGGTREKDATIYAAWDSGEFKYKTECASHLEDVVNLSYSTIIDKLKGR